MEALLVPTSKSNFSLISEMLIMSTGLGGSFLVVISVGFVTNLLDTPHVIQAKAKAGEKIVDMMLT